MKIYDCFLFNDENHILEIRLNELNKFVDYFVIVEFGQTHQGSKKGQLIDQKILKKFEKKIRYFYFESFEENLGVWERDSHQRNQISKGIEDASQNDVIIISDIDEIPSLSLVDFSKINDFVYAFSQLHSMYKLNLYRENRWWIGSKLCLKKNLISPQWLRVLKVNKKYSIFRIDKLFSKTYYRKFKVIENGGWHLAWLKNADQIIKKINSYTHTEFNIEKYNQKNYIQQCIDKKTVFFDENEKLYFKKENLILPNYVNKNLDRYAEWILTE